MKDSLQTTLEELSIKVNIADRVYPLKVTAQQEELVRKAAKHINDKVKSLQTQFAVQDKQDILAMIVLETVTELQTLQSLQATKKAALKQEVQEMLNLLDNINLSTSDTR